MADKKRHTPQEKPGEKKPYREGYQVPSPPPDKPRPPDPEPPKKKD